MIPTFIKWAGGKRRIIDAIENQLPKIIERYFEPFIGAGAVFFYIKEKYKPRYCLISDINEDLINTYLAVRDKVDLLMYHLRKYKKNHSDEFYYEIREKFNANKIRGVNRAASFIYLNKTCFNGLYRVNSKNEFNVPIGRQDNTEIFNMENLKRASKLLRGVKIKIKDYREIASLTKEGDLVYLDPCYDPLTKKSFANYTPERFNESDRHELYKFIEKLNDKKIKFLLSNNNLEIIRSLYKGYNISKLMVSRPINSVASGRGKIPELLIRNY